MTQTQLLHEYRLYCTPLQSLGPACRHRKGDLSHAGAETKPWVQKWHIKIFVPHCHLLLYPKDTDGITVGEAREQPPCPSRQQSVTSCSGPRKQDAQPARQREGPGEIKACKPVGWNLQVTAAPGRHQSAGISLSFGSGCTACCVRRGPHAHLASATFGGLISSTGIAVITQKCLPPQVL